MGCKLSGFSHGGNSIVKCAQVGVVLGWVTSREVLVLHLSKHYMYPVIVECSIFPHDR